MRGRPGYGAVRLAMAHWRPDFDDVPRAGIKPTYADLGHLNKNTWVGLVEGKKGGRGRRGRKTQKYIKDQP